MEFVFFIQISLNLLQMVTVDNIPTLAQIMAWRRTGAKPLSELMAA